MNHTNSPLVLYNTECKSGGVQKLSGAVFCTRGSALDSIKSMETVKTEDLFIYVK